MRKVYLRPTRSPSRPNTSAPNGRTAKPAAKASSAKMKRGRRVHAREELLADDRGERAVQVEVVPLEDRAERRREDDGALFLRDGLALLRHRRLRGLLLRDRSQGHVDDFPSRGIADQTQGGLRFEVPAVPQPDERAQRRTQRLRESFWILRMNRVIAASWRGRGATRRPGRICCATSRVSA